MWKQISNLPNAKIEICCTATDLARSQSGDKRVLLKDCYSPT